MASESQLASTRQVPVGEPKVTSEERELGRAWEMVQANGVELSLRLYYLPEPRMESDGQSRKPVHRVEKTVICKPIDTEASSCEHLRGTCLAWP